MQRSSSIFMRVLGVAALLVGVVAVLLMLQIRTSPERSYSDARPELDREPEDTNESAVIRPDAGPSHANMPPGSRAPVSGSVVIRVTSTCGSERTFDLELRSPDGIATRRDHAASASWGGLALDHWLVRCSRQGWESRETAVDLSGDHPTAELHLEMKPTAVLRGQVIDDQLGTPLQQYSVSVEARFTLPNGVVGFASEPPEVIESESGSFCIPCEEPRAQFCRIHCWADGYEEFTSEWAQLSSTVIEWPPFPLHRSAKNWRSIEGVVVDELGRPISGAIVEAIPSQAAVLKVSVEPGAVQFDVAGAGESSLKARSRRRSVSNLDGRFAVDVLASEETFLHSWREGFAPLVSERLHLEMGPEDVWVTLVMKTGAKITGNVFLPGEDGSGWPRQVIIQDDLQYVRRDLRFGEDPLVADFKMTGIPPGEYRLTIRGSRFKERTSQEALLPLHQERLSVVREDAEIHVDIDLTGYSGSLSGVLEASMEGGIGQGAVYLFPLSDLTKPARTAWLSVDGSFRFLSVDPMGYVVLAIAVGESRSRSAVSCSSIEVRAGGESIRLTTLDTTIQGTVEFAINERPRRMVLGVVRADPDDDVGQVLQRRLGIVTSNEGEFEIAGLPPGEYVIDGGSGSARYVGQVSVGQPPNISIVTVRCQSGQ